MVSLAEEAPADATQLFDDDIAELGFVMNVSRLWAYQPRTLTRLFDLMGGASGAELSFRQRGILVTACASTFGDSYCSIAWGSKLANRADAETAAAVRRAMAHCASPNGRWRIGRARSPAIRTASPPPTCRRSAMPASRTSDLRDDDLCRAQHCLLHRQRRTRCTTGRAFRATAPAAVLEAVT